MICPSCNSDLIIEEADDVQAGEDDQDTVLVDYTRCTDCNCKWIEIGDQIIFLEVEEEKEECKKSNQTITI